MDNRPLRFDEFRDRVGQTVYMSATPGNWEMEQAHGQYAEQVIRPTGLVDPRVVVRPTKDRSTTLCTKSVSARHVTSASW